MTKLSSGATAASVVTTATMTAAEEEYEEALVHADTIWALQYLAKSIVLHNQRKFRRDTSELRKVAKRVRAGAWREEK